MRYPCCRQGALPNGTEGDLLDHYRSRRGSEPVCGVTYLSGSQQAVTGFAHIGYPQQLRVLLGIAKPLGAIALLMPGWPRLKEWAYAGFTFAWIAATVAHYRAGDGAQALAPVVLLVLLGVSYATRPAGR